MDQVCYVLPIRPGKAVGPDGDRFVVYLESADFAATVAAYTASDDPFDA